MMWLWHMASALNLLLNENKIKLWSTAKFYFFCRRHSYRLKERSQTEVQLSTSEGCSPPNWPWWHVAGCHIKPALTTLKVKKKNKKKHTRTAEISVTADPGIKCHSSLGWQAWWAGGQSCSGCQGGWVVEGGPGWRTQRVAHGWSLAQVVSTQRGFMKKDLLVFSLGS